VHSLKKPQLSLTKLLAARADCKPRLYLLFCLALCTGFSLFAQETNSVFVINSANSDVKGRTKHFALIRNGEIKIGEEIHGLEKLEKYISDKTQLLLNQRVLSTVKIDYTIGEADPDGKYPVDLVILVEDTWNIIALPYPKYDSNTGFELILKARDYNFLGRMNPLRLDIGYKYDQNNRNALLIELESDTPFTALGYNWNLYFNHYFDYRPDAEEPFYYKNLTGLAMQLPFRATTFTFGIDETFFVNDENADSQKPKYGEFQKGLFMQTNLYTTWKIPTGIEIADYGELTYTPHIAAVFPHEFQEWPLADYRKGASLKFNHSFGFSKIDWLGNYRKGLYAYLTNNNSYNFSRLADGREPLSLTFSASAKGHFIISEHFGISSYLQYRHWFYKDPNYYDNAGDVLRGIIDKAVRADYMLSLNLDFPIKLFTFMPSDWFKTRQLRVFDFEMHLSPIIDMALYHDPEKNIEFSFENMLVAGGFEVIVFPYFFRSLYLRISLGWNIIRQIDFPRDYYLNPVLPIIPMLPMGNDREIFVGIGHHY
jgi:hypothetical protein